MVGNIAWIKVTIFTIITINYGASVKTKTKNRTMTVGSKNKHFSCEKSNSRNDRGLSVNKSPAKYFSTNCKSKRILINATEDMRPAPGEVCVESIDGGWRRKFVFGEIVKGKSNGTYYCNETYLGGRMKHKLTIWNVAVIERSTSPPVTTASKFETTASPSSVISTATQSLADIAHASSAVSSHVQSTPKSSGGNSSGNLVIATTSAVVVLVVLVLVGLGMLRHRSKVQTSVRDMLMSQVKVYRQWEFPREHLELLNELGSGFFGAVYEGKAYGITEPETWTSVAVKLANDEGMGHSSLCDEAKLMSGLESYTHKNVLRLLGVCSVGGPLCLILEYATHGNLKSYLQSRKDGQQLKQSELNSNCGCEITPNKMFNFSLQIAAGMEHLMSRKILHCDLAARNVLVFENEILKICDFGMAKDVRYVYYFRDQSQTVMPVRWMSPEVMLDKVHCQATDVWSFGIVLWETATFGGTPYPGISVEQLYDLLTKNSYRMSCPVNCPPKLHDIMLWCWHADKTQRPTFSALVEQLSDVLNGITNNDDPYNQSTVRLSGSAVALPRQFKI
ncbi:fibroblast growth factor receptor 2-like isoform X2 [Corticium candelabrum]|uniref:fibroblast growth factor receptor 2-like isoform X2 n=1 Tax=Corticium candelabrum TaxID=121492 RepID=UPI002E2655C3|nr:fibroblast growth factor receptor 2-like isoform X2 [Corticium candelabrum]